MSALQKFLTGFGVFALLALFSIPACADAWNEKTIMTFSAPVEVPGRILPAGQYVFKLFNSQSERNIVQIWNGSGTRLLHTIDAIPIYRRTTTANTVVTLEKLAPHAPEAVHTWFYPGHDYGLEFVYPHRPGQRS